MDVIAYLQVLMVFAVVVQLLFHDVCILDDVICNIVMQTLEEHHHLPQLTRKHHRPPPSNLPKSPCIQYNYKRAEKSVLSDWVGVAPRFSDRQFEQT